MLKKIIASLLIPLILIQTVGCFPYKKVDIENKDAIEKGGHFKITLMNNTVYYFTDIVIEDSILIGTENIGRSQNRKVRLPADDIYTVETQNFNPGLTVLAVLPILGIVILAAMMKRAGF